MLPQSFFDLSSPVCSSRKKRALNKMADLDLQIEMLKACKLISEKQVMLLCSRVIELLVEESNIVRVDVCIRHGKSD